MSKKVDRLDRFLEFLYLSESENLNELGQDLRLQGVDVGRVQNSISEMLHVATRKAQLSWIDRARVKRERLNQRMKEYLEAIAVGSLGVDLQARGAVFFRNKTADQISVNETRSFREDCDLLKILQDEMEEEPEPGARKSKRAH